MGILREVLEPFRQEVRSVRAERIFLLWLLMAVSGLVWGVSLIWGGIQTFSGVPQGEQTELMPFGGYAVVVMIGAMLLINAVRWMRERRGNRP